MSGSAPGPDLSRLMQAAQAGDSDAYLALLTAISPIVRRIVEKQRGFAGREAVEDIVQDVLLSVHAVRATYDPARPFMPWLLAIVRHRLADGARRYARTVAREVVVDNLDVTFEATPANSDQEENRQRLREAITALPAGQRQAIELLKVRELSLREAAAESGQSIGALKVATHRAMAALRRALGAGREHR
jgi:RNA polymerase sigma-70 factor (ECF subfamily)